MFEVAISQSSLLPTVITVYFPFLNRIFVSIKIWLICISKVSVARQLCANSAKMPGSDPPCYWRACPGEEAQDYGKQQTRFIAQRKGSAQSFVSVGFIALLRLIASSLVKSNLATDLPPEFRISDEDILHNINTFMFAGSDTSSLSVTWTLLLLAEHTEIQTRLREELLTVPIASSLPDEEVQSLHEAVANLPFLDNVTRESLRLIPPVHSSIRVATQDDVIPTKYAIHRRDGTTDESGVKVAKGSFVHVAIEAFNLDKAIWGQDAWEFK